ncbi:MAG TPA: hypothetical protein VFW07_19920 [Parafilimonas sp.]|nr:hypothetical protein [Parafilimonas sp.]
MKIIIISLVAAVSFLNHNTNDDVIEKMYKQYAGKWMKSFSFTQTTQMYRNDSLVNTSTWYENIAYPDKFRIDFGSKTAGNAALFVNDSIYSFRNSKLNHVSANDENLTFILGGMYFYPLDSVTLMLRRMGYNLNKSYETSLNDKPAYVVGANNGEEKANQLWIDKEKLVIVKIISYNRGDKEEGIFSNHKQFGNGWSETLCSFYVNGTLVQKETYYDCKADENIDLKIFDPYNFSLLQ